MVDAAGQSLSEEELAELAVRCLTLDLHDMKLMLPNTLVAEVIETIEVRRAANAPDWLAGFVSWRGRNVPLLSYEKLLGRKASGRSVESRMVILNTLNGNPRIPFIGVEIQGLPRLSLLKHGMVEYHESEDMDEPSVLSSMRIDGEVVVIPNLDTMERMLENLGISA